MSERGNSCVIKLGGSVIFSDRLDAWLKIIGEASKTVVIVPGGGQFADEVRSAQRQFSFSDEIAHERALLAMNRSAEFLAGHFCQLAVAYNIPAFYQALKDHRIPVWAPYPMCVDRDDIPASWAVTSDSLAAWLAGELRIEELYLIKSAVLAAQAPTAHDLSRDGFVDEAFPDYLARAPLKAFYVGPKDKNRLADALRGKTCKFSPITLAWKGEASDSRSRI